MANPQRLGAALLAVVALGMTATGVVWAATDSSNGAAGDPLDLRGYPPRTAQLHVTISTGQAYNVSGDLNVNFSTNALSGRLLIPMAFSAVPVDVRLVHHHLYLGSPNLATVVGKGWVSMNSSQPDLYGLALEMTKPDLALISGFTTKTVTHNGSNTTYDYVRQNATIRPPAGLPITVPTNAAIDFSITVGSGGEVAAAKFTVTSKTSTAWIAVTVTSYNQPARIVAPPPSKTVPVTQSGLSKIFGGSAGSLLAPLATAGQGQLS